MATGVYFLLRETFTAGDPELAVHSLCGPFCCIGIRKVQRSQCDTACCGDRQISAYAQAAAL